MANRVLIVSFPWKSDPPYKFLSDILLILKPISDKIIVVSDANRVKYYSHDVHFIDTGVKMHYVNEYNPKFISVVYWIIKSIVFQLRASIIIANAKDYDIVMFYMAYPFFIIPLITATIFKKKTFEVITRSKPRSLISKILAIQDPFLYRLLSYISPESTYLIKELGLNKYSYKIVPEGARFIDTQEYTSEKTIDLRGNKIGFLSRINKKKGIMEFIEAIKFLEKKNHFNYMIGGDGDLVEWLNKECNQMKKKGVSIDFFGWVDDVPNFLNEIKLLVLPSHEDAFPTIILEAMACGTPVLVTDVGSIKSIVKDGETGFIIENNTPEFIASYIEKILLSEDLPMIVKNSSNLVENKFSFEKALKRWQTILNILN